MSEELLSNNNRDKFILTTQLPDPEAQDLEYITYESDAPDQEAPEEPQIVDTNNANNLNNNDDDRDYIPPFMYEDQLFDQSTTFDCSDLEPGQLHALRAFIQSLRNENKP